MLKLFRNDVIARFKNSSRKLIILDYDGTLVNHVNKPETAIPSAKLLKTIKLLSDKPNTDVLIISGRKHDDIEDFFGTLEIDLIADHGAKIKQDGAWNDLLNTDTNWKGAILTVLKDFNKICPGAFIEEKEFSISWHYRTCLEKDVELVSRQLIEQLLPITSKYKLKILDGNKVIEVLMKDVGKGKALSNLLINKEYDYILCIGDDKTDEEMFEILIDNENSDSVKVGEGLTYAKYRLNNVIEVIELIEEIVKPD